MPWNLRKCKECGTSKDYISTRGNCIKCALEKAAKPSKQLKSKKGKYFDAWLRGTLRHAGLDDKQIERVFNARRKTDKRK